MSPTAFARYPGRLCLVGEHCDWAGGASLAVPLRRGILVRAETGAPGSGVRLSTQLDGEPLEAVWSVAGAVDRTGGPLRFVPAVLYALAERGLEVPDVRLEVRSDLPSGRGFSSSAAFTLAVTEALSRVAGHVLSRDELARVAYYVERMLLGVECGLLDQLACAARAPVLIRWGEEVTTDRAPDAAPLGPARPLPRDGASAGRRFDLRTVSPRSDLHLLVGAFPTPRDTRSILRELNRDHRAGGAATRHAFTIFERAALDAAEAMEAGELERLGTAMNAAQQAYQDHLEADLTELSAPRVRAVCSALRARGALGAKFSGAGGDGSVVALFRTSSEVADAIALLEGEFGVSALELEVRAP